MCIISNRVSKLCHLRWRHTPFSKMSELSQSGSCSLYVIICFLYPSLEFKNSWSLYAVNEGKQNDHNILLLLLIYHWQNYIKLSMYEYNHIIIIIIMTVTRQLRHACPSLVTVIIFLEKGHFLISQKPIMYTFLGSLIKWEVPKYSMIYNLDHFWEFRVHFQPFLEA